MLSIRGISKNFGGLAAVSSVDLEINEGEILGLIGPNGSGKTTLINLINGVHKPTTGKMLYQGENISGKPSHILAQKGIARTFQQNLLFKDFKVWENVQIACEAISRKKLKWPFSNFLKKQNERKNNKKIALDILDRMNILEWKDKLCNDLPHGIQRMVQIAMAMALDPKLILLDEPLTGMHLNEMADVIDQIKRLNKEGVTIVIVEHHTKVIMNLCDRIAVLNFGKKIAEGLPVYIKNHAEVIKAYLGDTVDDL